VVRSDASEAHRLSLSARVLSAEHGQVKAKREREKPLWRLRNQYSAPAWLRPAERKPWQPRRSPIPFFTRVIYGQHLKPVLKLKAYLPLPARESGISPSLLIIVIIIFVAVVVGLIGGLMRCVALVVP
jgi:hypothetical protein